MTERRPSGVGSDLLRECRESPAWAAASIAELEAQRDELLDDMRYIYSTGAFSQHLPPSAKRARAALDRHYKGQGFGR
jgi:hypothetical protein